MNLRPLRIHLSALLLPFILCCCGSTGPVPGAPCDTALDCGPQGDAVCLEGSCRIFDQNTGWGSAQIDLSFDRNMYQAANSGYVYIIMNRAANGSPITCEQILSGQIHAADEDVNLLMASPKYLVFHWSSGGTFFPNNLVQFIRPGQDVLAVAEGYSGLEGLGTLSALGCEPADGEESITIVADEVTEFSIQLDVP